MGDLTTTCWSEDEFWVVGSYYLRSWHLRWFADHLPGDGSVTIRDLSDAVAGVAVCGPGSTELLTAIACDPVDLGFMSAGELDLGLNRVRAVRMSVTGELGYELNLPAGELPGLYRALRQAGAPLGAVPIGYAALDSLRLEKSYGIWNHEFTQGHTPLQCGLDRFVDYDKSTFVGRDAALAERDSADRREGGAEGSDQRLVTFEVSAEDADASVFDPVWVGDHRIGYVTSGGYGHCVGASLALGYIDRAHAEVGTEVEIHVVGRRRPARVIAPSPVDPQGLRPRA